MPSTSGRPPVYPASARQPQAVRQRRLSFSLAADAGASALDRLHAEPLLPGDSDFEPLAGGILAADDFDAALAAAERRVVSLSTLRRLSRNEDARRRLSGTEAVAAREASAVLAALPRTFSRLQRAGIRALAEHAPEYVQLKPYGACGTPAVWVDRGADARAVMGRLMALAEGRHAAREPLLPQP
ncbi:hypothetical protein F751_6232 [Auxenochlorella protothecoides]|uniref:Uncharacterized protein n=1 Tax=Auxenochlorella protothecoides TaxID=3075 RepID=A0A087SK27_AUXPR|nr:hypothetical protein F751_6232 [Auxenochlorella protothecoides]KFM26081.1 hypothetical protein F751_6232 [Auxenochlorella protothecoides]